MSIKWGSASRPTFRQDFFRLVDARVEVAGRVMPGCVYTGLCRRDDFYGAV